MSALSADLLDADPVVETVVVTDDAISATIVDLLAEDG